MPSSKPTLIGQKVGEYDIIGQIGRGGMGVVYEGVQSVIGKRVAVKVLLPQLSADEELVQRFVAEARAVNAIRHRGIVDIFSFGQLDNGSSYFVMEYLEGEPLDAVFKQRAPLPAGAVLAILEETLDALDAAHSAEVIHRDIKPSNLFLVTARGRSYLKLLDFGVAKLSADNGHNTPVTRASVVVGTPTYMSPEQIRGAKATPASDIYALGCVAYEGLTGKPPYAGENGAAVMFAHVGQPVPSPRESNPKVPEAIDELVRSMLAKSAAERPGSAAELRDTIASLRFDFPDEGFLGAATPTPSGKHRMPKRATPAAETRLPNDGATKPSPAHVPVPSTQAETVNEKPRPGRSGNGLRAALFAGLLVFCAGGTWLVMELLHRAAAAPPVVVTTIVAPRDEPAPPPPPAPAPAAVAVEPAPAAAPAPEPAKVKPSRAAARVPTQQELDTRLAKLKTKVEAQEKSTGDADPVLHNFLDQAREQVAQAKTPEKRSQAASFLADVERQVESRR